MPFDWTAAVFGLLATAVGSLLASVALLVRRELDHLRERVAAAETRLRDAEQALFLLSPLAKQMERKMDEQVVTIRP
jgi:hypothetical protein